MKIDLNSAIELMMHEIAESIKLHSRYVTFILKLKAIQSNRHAIYFTSRIWFHNCFSLFIHYSFWLLLVAGLHWMSSIRQSFFLQQSINHPQVGCSSSDLSFNCWITFHSIKLQSVWFHSFHFNHLIPQI